jgi:pimeloyl-ACP methyl ester carboxylesterase
MPFANNNGVKIYYEVEGQGPPLVLAHGAIESLYMWKKVGYVDALKNDYTLVLLDFRAHGQSDKPYEASAYGPNLYEKLIGDVLAVLDDLNIRRTHYYGFSMGARTGYQLAVNHPDRFNSFILGSFSPFELTGYWADFVKTSPEILRLYLTDVEAAVSKQEQNLGHTFSADERKSFLATFQRFDVKAQLAMSQVEYTPLTVNEVAGISKPCLIYCGDSDDMHSGARKASRFIPQSTFISLPGFDHMTAFENIDMILPHIKEFLAQVSKA